MPDSFLDGNNWWCIVEPQNACNNHPCFNGATCTPNGADYTCTCATGFQGINCETGIANYI